MDRLRDQFLPGAGFSLDQYGAGDRSHLFDPDQQLLDGGTLSRYAGTLLQLAPVHQALDECHGIGRVDRLDRDFGDVETQSLSVSLGGIGRLEQRQGRDLRVPRLCHQLLGPGSRGPHR